LEEVVVIHSIIVSTGGSAVVRLGRMRNAKIVGQSNSLRGQPLLVGVTRGRAVILSSKSVIM
jgi:hypothetical protein